MSCYHLLQVKCIKIAKHPLHKSLDFPLIPWVLSLEDLHNLHLLRCCYRTSEGWWPAGRGCVIRETGGSFEGVQRVMASDNIWLNRLSELHFKILGGRHDGFYYNFLKVHLTKEQGNGDLPQSHWPPSPFPYLPWCFLRWESYNKDPSLPTNGKKHFEAIVNLLKNIQGVKSYDSKGNRAVGSS